MVDVPQHQLGRLSFRVEGDKWVAYYALPDTMKDALWLGAVHMGLVASDIMRKQLFMQLMQDAVSDIIEKATGQRPIWPNPPTRAPEHERSGRG